MAGGTFSSLGMMAMLGIGLLTAAGQGARPTVPAADLQAPLPVGRTIERSTDGLFYVEARLNGVPIRLVLDTGANVTVLSSVDAGARN